MALTPGFRIGPYEIVGTLGAGGMGEVYRAKDTRLDRLVAIKVLPPGVTADADRRARFEREAKAIAALSHPNILAIHDLGESPAPEGEGGWPVLYAVTELLEGETLRDRLTAQGTLPIRKVIEIAVQIARGLSAAHERGVIHRDLKPENVFLIKDGQVKILDFGLARQSEPMATATVMTRTAAAITEPGTVMGTAGYMAPEQVRGEPGDARTDLFAFGATVYEMLSGQRAFRRDTPAETMTAILRDEPAELSSTRGDLSPALDRIVRHCLEKHPAERFQTARDVAFALEAFSGSHVGSGPLPALPRPRRPWRAAAIAALVAAAASAGYATKAWLAPAAPPPIAFETRTWEPQWISNARFAPDGQAIIYSAAGAGNLPSLFVMRPGMSVAQPLGAPRTHLLAVSKTGELAVLTGVTHINHRDFRGTLARMSMDGGTRALMEDVREADWSPDGSTLAIVHDLGRRDRIEYPAGTALYEASGYLSDLRVAPDGTRVAFFEHPNRWDDRGWLKVVDREKRVTTLAGEFWGGQGLAWSPRGRIIFFSMAMGNASGYLPYAVNADSQPRARVAFPSIVGTTTMDAAADGRLLYTAGESSVSMRALVPGETAERELPWLEIPLVSDMSQDGRWILFSDEGPTAGANYAVSLRKTDGTPAVRLGEGLALGLSRDGQWALGYVPSPAPGRYAVYPTGAGQPKTVEFAPVTQIVRAGWLPDGRVFACGTGPAAQRRCFRKDVSGGAPEPITPDGVLDGWASPDGRSMLVQNAERRWQMVDLASGATREVPGDHGNDIVGGWSRDSRSVFVRVSTTIPAPVDRIDLSSGARTHVRDVMPGDRTGVMGIYPGPIVSDGQGYAYSYWRQSQKAVVVSGVPGDR